MRLLTAFVLLILAMGFGMAQVWAEREPVIPIGRTGARLAGMGGAGVALPGDVENMAVNPATLVYISRPSVVLGYGNQDLSDQSQYDVAGALPLIGQLVVGVEAIELRQISPTINNLNTYLFSFAFPLSNNGKLLLGVNAKFLQQGISSKTDVFQGGGLDLGLFYNAWESSDGMRWLFGAAWSDAQTKLKNQQEEITLPSLFRLGTTLYFDPDRVLTIAFESQTSPVPEFDSFTVMRAGLEQGFAANETLSLQGRVGYLKRMDRDGVLCVGLGSKFGEWRIDYSLQTPFYFYNAYHQLSLTWAAAGGTPAPKIGAEAENAPLEKKTVKKEEKNNEVQVFSALESAAKIDDETLLTKKLPEPTPAPTPQGLDLSKSKQPEEETETYHMPVPEGPAASETTSLGAAPEMPAYFSGYFTGGNGPNDEFKIARQSMRLLVVVNPFSPNGDGRQDKTMFVGRLLDEKLKVARWLLTISQNSTILKYFRGSSTLPRNLEWDGTDTKGKILPDGTYTATLHAMNENGLEVAAVNQKVAIKTKAQLVNISSPGNRTLSGTKIKPFMFELPEIKGSKNWKFSIANPQGKTVFQKSSDREIPRKVNWAPALPDERITEGEYRVRFTYQDEVGLANEGETKFRIQFSKFELELHANAELFKPVASGGKGVGFEISHDGEVHSQRWRLDILEGDAQDNAVKTFSGNGELPKTVQWDGVLENGKPAQGGQVYQAMLSMVSSLGSEGSANSEKFQCDVGDYTGQKALEINLVRITFLQNSYTISKEAGETLKGTIQNLEKYKTDYRLQVIGHCDKREDKTLELSRSRAQATADFLIHDAHISEEKIQVIGKGSMQPVAQDDNEASHVKNQRVEIVLFAH